MLSEINYVLITFFLLYSLIQFKHKKNNFDVEIYKYKIINMCEVEFSSNEFVIGEKNVVRDYKN